jgi:hypothetical protein
LMLLLVSLDEGYCQYKSLFDCLLNIRDHLVYLVFQVYLEMMENL